MPHVVVFDATVYCTVHAERESGCFTLGRLVLWLGESGQNIGTGWHLAGLLCAHNGGSVFVLAAGILLYPLFSVLCFAMLLRTYKGNRRLSHVSPSAASVRKPLVFGVSALGSLRFCCLSLDLSGR